MTNFPNNKSKLSKHKLCLMDARKHCSIQFTIKGKQILFIDYYYFIN